MKWQQYRKRASLSHDAADFDAAMMIFHDAVGKREAETGAVALGGVERPENVGQVLRRDAAAGVADNHAGTTLSRANLNTHCARLLHGLNCVQEQIQKHLVNLIAVVLDFGQIGRLLQFDLDWS